MEKNECEKKHGSIFPCEKCKIAVNRKNSIQKYCVKCANDMNRLRYRERYNRLKELST